MERGQEKKREKDRGKAPEEQQGKTLEKAPEEIPGGKRKTLEKAPEETPGEKKKTPEKAPEGRGKTPEEKKKAPEKRGKAPEKTSESGNESVRPGTLNESVLARNIPEEKDEKGKDTDVKGTKGKNTEEKITGRKDRERSDSEKNRKNRPESQRFSAKIAGFPLPIYFLVLILTAACMYAGCLPEGLVGSLLLLMVLGEGLNAIGNSVPVVKTYLGGSVICILGAAALQAAGVFPKETYEMLDSFVNRDGFLVFYISALITGSLFNIDRDLLIRATVKLLPTAVVSLAAGVAAAGLLGMVMGNSFLEGILFIGIPMTSGGMTAGAVPLSAMYSPVLGIGAGEILTKIAPATVLGNCVAIIFGGLANNLGDRRPSLTGNGRLVNDGQKTPERPPMKPTFALLCTGLIISLAFYGLGALGNRFVSIVPAYAWMIIAVVVVKGTGILSEELEDAAREWGQFAIHSWTAAALTGIGATLIDLKTILHTLTPFYLFTIVAAVAVITLTAGILGRAVGFYPLEASIAAGMCTTNMGGSGNVAVLSSAKRMELLPFAQIVTRSCGALMLTLGGVLVHLLR